MDLIRFLNEKEEQNVIVAINAGDLIYAIDYCVSKTREELEKQVASANTGTYPSPEQVAKRLDVSRATLWRWAKCGYLTPIEVGGKRRYRMSDVKKILGQAQSGKS